MNGLCNAIVLCARKRGKDSCGLHCVKPTTRTTACNMTRVIRYLRVIRAKILEISMGLAGKSLFYISVCHDLKIHIDSGFVFGQNSP